MSPPPPKQGFQKHFRGVGEEWGSDAHILVTILFQDYYCDRIWFTIFSLFFLVLNFWICIGWSLFNSLTCVSSETYNLQCIFCPGWGGGVIPFIGYIGMCRAKGLGFLAVLVWNRVSILTIVVWNRVWFVQCSLELGMFFRRISYFFIIWQ